MMRPSIGNRWIAVAAFVSACAGESAPPSQAPAAAAPQVVSLATTEYAFEAPDTIAPGWTTLRLANRGHEIHYGHIVQLEPGRTVQDLVDAYAHAIRTSGPRPKWVKRFGGPGGVAPGDSSSVTQLLEPGNYVWICPIEDSTGAPHFGKGEVKSFTVHAAGGAPPSAAAAPQGDVEVRLLDFSFAVDTPLTAGKHTIRVANAGVEPHDLVLMKLAPGRSAEDLAMWLNPEQARRDEPAADPPASMADLGTLGGGIAAIAPGMEAFFDLELAAGEYVLLCMATAPDGKSHIEHGMIRQVSVR
jgi:hypothetical protein